MIHAISNCDITHVACSDKVVHSLVNLSDSTWKDSNIDSWTTTILGGDPLSEQNLLKFEAKVKTSSETKMQVGTAYGMTEAAGLISTSGNASAKTIALSLADLQNDIAKDTKNTPSRFVISGGKPSCGVQVAVLDNNNNILPVGEVGSVVFRSPSLFEGYGSTGNSDTAKIDIHAPKGCSHSGFFPTGDNGFILNGKEGNEIAIVGRQKELVPSENGVLYPMDLETAAFGVLGFVNDVSVIAVPDLTNEFQTQLIIVGLREKVIESDYYRIVELITGKIQSNFPGTCVRIVIVLTDHLPQVPTSVKKPRTRTAIAFSEGKIPTLFETSDYYLSSRGVQSSWPRPWVTEDPKENSSWCIELGDREKVEIEGFLSSSGPVQSNEAPQFSNEFDQIIARAVQETQKGFGLALIRGFPFEFDRASIKEFIFQLGTRMGKVVPQNIEGELVAAVTDRSNGNKRIRGYSSNVPLDLHSDTSDVLALFCVRRAKEGGRSVLVSSLKIYEIIRKERPDILPILMKGFRYRYPEMESPTRVHIPVFSDFGGAISCRILRAFIEAAGSLDPQEKEALDVFEDISKRRELNLSLDLKHGDLLLLNNFAVLHSRTGFVDHVEEDRKRFLFRLWLNDVGDKQIGPRYKEQSHRFQE